MPTNTTTLAILKDGTPIRIHLFENPAFDVDGFLIQFTKPGIHPEVYRYHQHSEFKREDRKKPDLTGYYNESIFLKYIQNIDPVPTLDKLVKHDFKNNLAFEGEEITVSTIDFDSPYDYFYNSKNYTFNLQLSPDKRGVANYRKLIMENYRIVDSKINTDGQVPVVALNNQSTTPGGYFFKKNLGDFINNWAISDIQKSTFKRIISLIVFKIREINRDIIPIIATNTHFFDKEFDVANGIIDYNDNTNPKGFTELEKLLFDLKRGWGYYYSPLNAEDFPLREDFDAHLTSLSSYEDYFAYLSSLENFYSKCYSTKNLAFYKSDEKLQYLLEILPPSALSLLPFKLILKTIKKYLKINLSQEDQRLLVRLVISVTKSHANEFLDFLLEKEDGAKTNFQTIYEALTDARLERYTFVNWFVDEQPNRKYFAFAVYELWKVSKFNLGYISPGTNPILVSNNFQGVDPKNYFVNNKQEYNTNNILTFSSSRNDFTNRETLFESAINNRRIDIKKIETEDSALYHIHNRIPTLFGSFHLFQEISFSGLEANLDLMIPKTATVPAFLFHFIEEYDRLADFDAGVSLAIDLTADILLMYFTGGASVLRDLQYLKYTNNIGKALQGSLSATEAVEVWRGLEVGSEIFTVTTGELAHINQYLIATENNEKKKKILEKNQKILLTLMMAGVGSSVTARSKAVQEADETLRLIDALLVNTPHNIPQPMIDVLTTLSGQKAVTLSLFGNKLNNLELAGAANTIAAKYNMLFTDAQRLKFWNDFQQIDDPAFWKLLNSGKGANGALNGSYIDNWISLSERGLIEAKFSDYICVQRRTDFLLNIENYSALKSAINSFNFETKLKFVKDFENSDNAIIELLNEYSESIKVWIGHTSEGKTLIGQHAEIWLKHFKARELLKNIQYQEVSRLFGKEAKTKTIVQGIKYITDRGYLENDLKKAIEIANRSDDVIKISDRLNIPYEIINKVKKHYYIDEQFMLLDDEFYIGRFERTGEDNKEWLRMADGPDPLKPLDKLTDYEIEAFKRLVSHEYVELKLMEKGLSYRSLNKSDYQNLYPYEFGAHDIAPITGNGKFADLKRASNPPSLILNNYDNLEKIINWYINFYKL